MTGRPATATSTPTTSTMAAAVRAYRISARHTAASTGEMVVAGLFFLLVTAVLSRMWEAAAESNGGAVAGYSAVALVWYITATECAVSSIPVRLIEDIGDDIVDRRIELELLRPVDVLTIRVATQFGRVSVRMALAIVLGLGFASLAGGAPPSPIALLLAGPALVLAVALNIVIQHAFAAATFWVGEAKGSWFLYQKLVFLAGGMLLPLEVLPATLTTIAKWLPFAAVAYVPGRLASGHVEPWWLAVQAGWLVLAVMGARRVFARGLDRLIGVGA